MCSFAIAVVCAYSVSKSPISLMAEANFQSSLDSEGSSSLTSDEPSVSSLPAKKNKTYDAAYKLKVIEYAAKHTNGEAGRKFNVGESSVRDWRKQKNKLAVLPSVYLVEVVEPTHLTLTAWIEDQRSRHLRVTRTTIQKKALDLCGGDDGFSASRGWLENFLRRNGFSLRRRTTVSQRLPQDFIPKVSSFILHVRKLRLVKNYQLSSIGNMDETPLWLDMPGDTTVSRIGERSVSNEPQVMTKVASQSSWQQWQMVGS